jgi:cytoskeletal protein RodZ
MKHRWLAYVIVALLAIGAGVAIAGLPDNSSTEDTITVSTATAPPETTEPTQTTEPTATTESTQTTEVTETTEPADTTTTSTTSTVPETTVPLVDRADLSVVTANGSGRQGTAAAAAARLEALGYVDVLPRNGTDVVDVTIVYYADGFEEAAVRLAEDLGLVEGSIAPLAEAPEVLDLPEGTELVAYIGLDLA